jgi:hypothetical protein
MHVGTNNGQVRTTSSKVAATSESGDMQTIPAQQLISFYKSSRDWRRVQVHWNGVPVEIALTAWEHAVEVPAKRRNGW